MNNLFFWIGAVVGTVLLLGHFFPAASMGQDSWLRIVYFVILLSFIGTGIFSRYSGRAGDAIKHITIWLGIFLLLIIFYSFRYEFGSLGERLTGEMQPYKAMESEGKLNFRKADDGHFYIEAEVNGQPVRFMVDTGATRVVLSPADAKRIGLNLSKLKFNQISYTANGVVSGAPVNLKTVKIGQAVIRAVPASVNGAEMNFSLLGMTFLDRLESYTVREDILTLRP